MQFKQKDCVVLNMFTIVSGKIFRLRLKTEHNEMKHFGRRLHGNNVSANYILKFTFVDCLFMTGRLFGKITIH